MTSYPTPEVGQVWADNDRRGYGRQFTITAVDETYVYSTTPRQTRILRNRMRPTSTGYWLVRLADGTPYRSEPTEDHR